MKSCIHLKSFAIRCADKSLASTYYHDDESQEAFTVPKKHGLRSLTLFGDTFTKPIILSVLNCCPRLRSLDVTNVAYLRLDEEEELRNKCLKIKDFRLFSPPPKVVCLVLKVMMIASVAAAAATRGINLLYTLLLLLVQ